MSNASRMMKVEVEGGEAMAYKTTQPQPKSPNGKGEEGFTKTSFKDKAMRKVGSEKVDLIEKNLFTIEHEDEDRLKSKCFVDGTISQELWNPWKEAVIIKLLGKRLSFFVMHDWLRVIWKLLGGFEMVDIG